MELSPGTLICGRFELMREESPNTGVPVFGPTWAVLDVERGEPARACLLDASLLPGEAERSACITALAELIDLRDPAIVPQVFVGLEGERVVVCYDPLQGAFALGDLYDGTGTFDLRDEAGKLARQLARALAGLHARGRVHGLLACEAVFVGPRGPAVFQSGFASFCARAELERRCRAFHVASLAPEVLRGGPFTPASDSYAWGATLAQFVTGQRGEAALHAPEPTGLPSGLWPLIHASLAADPEARPRDGAELVRRLDSLRTGPVEVVEPAPPPAAPQTPPPAAPVLESPPDPPAVPPRVHVPEDIKPASADDAGPARPIVPGKPLPVTSFEEMLLTSDRARRPATIPPGSLTSAGASGTGSHPVVDGDGKTARSSGSLRRVHVLTEDSIVLRSNRPTRPPDPSQEPSDVIIGGTKAEIEAASQATTFRLDPLNAMEAVQAAQAAQSAARLSESASKLEPVSAAPTTAEPTAAEPAPEPVSPTTPPPSAAPSAEAPPAKKPDPTFWWLIAVLVVVLIVAWTLS